MKILTFYTFMVRRTLRRKILISTGQRLESRWTTAVSRLHNQNQSAVMNFDHFSKVRHWITR